MGPSLGPWGPGAILPIHRPNGSVFEGVCVNYCHLGPQRREPRVGSARHVAFPVDPVQNSVRPTNYDSTMILALLAGKWVLNLRKIKVLDLWGSGAHGPPWGPHGSPMGAQGGPIGPHGPQPGAPWGPWGYIGKLPINRPNGGVLV
jgi:hypothetical protein